MFRENESGLSTSKMYCALAGVSVLGAPALTAYAGVSTLDYLDPLRGYGEPRQAVIAAMIGMGALLSAGLALGLLFYAGYNRLPRFEATGSVSEQMFFVFAVTSLPLYVGQPISFSLDWIDNLNFFEAVFAGILGMIEVGCLSFFSYMLYGCAICCSHHAQILSNESTDSPISVGDTPTGTVDVGFYKSLEQPDAATLSLSTVLIQEPWTAGCYNI